MDPLIFGVVTSYYRACWTDFSASRLSELFSNGIMWTGEDLYNTVVGRETVVKLYVDKFFSQVDIAKTRISNFSMKFNEAPNDLWTVNLAQKKDDPPPSVTITYRISQVRRDSLEPSSLHLEETLFIDREGLITLIHRKNAA